MSITQKALAEQDYIISLRRDFHAHPEISLKEYRTAQRIEEELDKLGIPHQRSGETGVYAEIKGGAARHRHHCPAGRHRRAGHHRDPRSAL